MTGGAAQPHRGFPGPDGPQDPHGSGVPGVPGVPGGAGRPGEPAGTAPTGTDERLGALSYAGVIVLGPIVPLVVCLTMGHVSPFVRRHAVQALNVALTWLLYGVSGAIAGALLAVDNPGNALLIMVPLAVIGWLVMVTHLVRAAVAASHGGFRRLPAWVCSVLVK